MKQRVIFWNHNTSQLTKITLIQKTFKVSSKKAIERALLMLTNQAKLSKNFKKYKLFCLGIFYFGNFPKKNMLLGFSIFCWVLEKHAVPHKCRTFDEKHAVPSMPNHINS